MAACKDHAPAGETKCTPDGCPPSCAGHDCYVCLDRAPVYQGAERYDAPVPQRDWRRWGFAYAAHFATGSISGFGLGLACGGYLPGAFAGSISLLVFTRQTVEAWRRNDTPGRDMGDHLAGVLLGGLTATALRLGGLL